MTKVFSGTLSDWLGMRKGLALAGYGLAIAYVPLTMVVMNATYAASAYPAGWLSDRMDRRLVLAMGAGVLIVADLVLAGASGIAWLIL